MENTLETTMGKKQIMGIVVLAALVVAAVLVFNSTKEPEAAKSVTEGTADSVQEAAKKIEAPAVTVPTSANPLRQALPKETPLQKTNPFNKTYVNPFE